MKCAVAIVFFIAGAANAFVAPSFTGKALAGVAKSSSKVSMSFEDSTGVTGPLGQLPSFFEYVFLFLLIKINSSM